MFHMIRSISAPGLFLAVMASLAGGCGGPIESDEARGAARQAIKGGEPDPDDTAVVYILWNGDLLAQCTGSLIAPNLVLTAQHCVAPLKNAAMGVDCAVTGFAAPDGPARFYVATKTMAPTAEADFHKVKEVLVPPKAKLCGGDVALLVLAESILPGEAVPLVPRVDSMIAKGDVYSAIGFGGTLDDGTGAGQRRRRDGLVVACVAEGCPPSSTGKTEWIGDQGICEGDSGGPAVDAEGRVIGVTSRGSAGCLSPTYGATFGWADWIKDGALHAAEVGGYEAPAWAKGAPTDPAFSAPVGGPCGDPPGCAPGTCVSDEAGSYCSRPCNDLAPCPDGYTCEAHDGASLCARPPPVDAGMSTTAGSGGSAPAPESDAGCGITGGERDTRGGSGFVGTALALGALARRRSVRSGQSRRRARGIAPAR